MIRVQLLLMLFPWKRCYLKSKTSEWRVNLFQKNLFNFKDDDGNVVTGTNEDLDCNMLMFMLPENSVN